jgi:hypothetical protein
MVVVSTGWERLKRITNALLYQLSYPGMLISKDILSNALRQMCRVCRLLCPSFILCRTESGTASLYRRESPLRSVPEHGEHRMAGVSGNLAGWWIWSREPHYGSPILMGFS